MRFALNVPPQGGKLGSLKVAEDLFIMGDFKILNRSLTKKTEYHAYAHVYKGLLYLWV